MPLGNAPLSASELALIEEWIVGGASSSICDGNTGPNPDPPVIAPGGTIDVGQPAGGFGGSAPSFAAGTQCSTGQWWQSADDRNAGFSMHPGRACVDCHRSSGDQDALLFRYAGTVMANLRDEDDCRGVPGVTVEILNANDAVIATATTNAAGNFGLMQPAFEEFRVRLTYDGRNREMLGHQASTGDCNSCHTAAGANGAPGRIVAP